MSSDLIRDIERAQVRAGAAAVPSTDAFPVSESDHHNRFQIWAAKNWPNSFPPDNAWEGWFAHAKESAQEPHWRKSYDMAVERLVLARKYMTASGGEAFDAEWKLKRAALRAAPAFEPLEPKTNTLLRRAMNRLAKWAINYGENNPSWLPPAGDVDLMEDVADHLGYSPEPVPAMTAERMRNA